MELCDFGFEPDREPFSGVVPTQRVLKKLTIQLSKADWAKSIHCSKIFNEQQKNMTAIHVSNLLRLCPLLYKATN